MEQVKYINNDFSESFREVLDIVQPEHVFLVTGRKSFESSGAKIICKTVLENITTTHFDDFDTNPDIIDIKTGMVAFLKSKASLVVAIGGGSVIDMAKSINALSVESLASPEDYIVGNKKLTQKGVPFIAVPTTAGSGSEATHFAVVYIKGKKYSLAHETILPDYVIVDPRLTMSLPSDITATTGLDALAQGIESYWSINSTDESKKYSRQAIDLAIKHLEKTVYTPDEISRKAMSEAAYYAGKAINISKTTAAHALSYSLTSHFAIPHGHAVFLTLPQIFMFNAEVSPTDVLDSRGAVYVKETLSEIMLMLGCSSTAEAKGFLESLMGKVNLPKRLSEFGVTEKNIIFFLEEVSSERMGNNPRKCSTEVVKNFYMSIL